MMSFRIRKPFTIAMVTVLTMVASATFFENPGSLSRSGESCVDGAHSIHVKDSIGHVQYRAWCYQNHGLGGAMWVGPLRSKRAEAVKDQKCHEDFTDNNGIRHKTIEVKVVFNSSAPKAVFEDVDPTN